MARKDLSTLRQEAATAVERGKLDKAIALYLELEELEPTDPAWPKRIGETHRRAGDPAAAVDAFERAADKYAQAGFLVQALAVCKLILQIDPERSTTATRLSELAPPKPIKPSVPVKLPQGAALDAIDLATVVRGTRGLTKPDGSDSGIRVLELEEEATVIELVAELPPPAAPAIAPAVRLALLTTPLFAQLPPQTLGLLITRMALVQLEPGEILFREGERGACLYVISEGEVVVETGGQELARLGPSAFFGEIALVTDLQRSATVRAAGRVELLAIDRDVMRDAMAERPEIINVLLGFVRDRLVDRIARTSELFRSFADHERAELSARFEFVEIVAGATLIVQGERADALYVVVAGRVEVWRDGETAASAVLRSGDVFGEISLLGGGGATASVRAGSRVLALRMPAQIFREVIMTHPQVLAYLGDLASRRAPSAVEVKLVDWNLELI